MKLEWCAGLAELNLSLVLALAANKITDSKKTHTGRGRDRGKGRNFEYLSIHAAEGRRVTQSLRAALKPGWWCVLDLPQAPPPYFYL